MWNRANSQYLYDESHTPLVRRDTYEETAGRFNRHASLCEYLGVGLQSGLPEISNDQWDEISQWISKTGIEL